MILALLTRLLFVGHSLVGPALPTMVAAGLEAAGQPMQVQAQVINGAPLGWNRNHGAEAEGTDGPRALAGGIDVLVLTEALPLAGHVAFSDSRGEVAAWAGLAWEGNPAAQVFVYETWHSLASGPGAVIPDDPGGAVPWRQRLDEDLAVWWSLAEAANAARPDTAPPVRLIPAGQAMGRLADAIDAGAVPGLGTIRDVFDDDIHPNGKGLYFVALVQVATITGTSPEGLPARLGRHWLNRAAVVPDDMAAAMQRVAWATVQDWQADEAGRLAGAPAAAAAQAAPALTAITNPNLGFGLAGVHDWSVQQPFLNVMKTARPWIAHRPGQWGGWEYADLVAGGHVTARGWPRSLPDGATGLTTLVLTDLPEEAAEAAGRYVLTWAGSGELRVEGRVMDMETGPNRIAFDFTPGAGSVVITVTALDPADPIRDLVLMRADRAEALAGGALFNPDWIARLQGVRLVRFMDWMATNNATLARAGDRPRPDDFTWALRGVPMEILVALANELGADPWFTLPHTADDALIRVLAEIARDGLAPGRVAHVEFSNEVWNWQFDQARWADEQALARWGQRDAWVQFYALRAAQAADIWAGVFADPARLRRVIATQTGWLGLEDQILNAPLVVAEGLPPPRLSFDAYAVTGYFAAALGVPDRLPLLRGWLDDSRRAAGAEAEARGLTGAARDGWIAAHRFDLAIDRAAAELDTGAVTGQATDTLDHLLGTVLPHHAAVARAAGLDLMMYEGGTHVVAMGEGTDDPDLTAFFQALNYAPAMGRLYGRLLAGWSGLTATPFTAFVDAETPTKWGSWGALRHLGDDNPRWRALARGCDPC